MWLCDRFKWTLEYVDGLDVREAYDTIETLQHGDKARADEQRKAARTGRRRGR